MEYDYSNDMDWKQCHLTVQDHLNDLEDEAQTISDFERGN